MELKEQNKEEAALRQFQCFQDISHAQQFLINARNLRPEQWELCSRYLRPVELQEVAEERACSRRCGYCKCNNSIVTLEEYQRQKQADFWGKGVETKKSIFDPVPCLPNHVLEFDKKKKVLVDVKAQLDFCSKSCFIEHQVLMKTMDPTPIQFRDIPGSSFKEVARLLMIDLKRNEAELKSSRTESKGISCTNELNLVKEELGPLNAMNITIIEKETISAPSTIFEDVEKKKKKKTKNKKVELPLFGVLHTYLDDSICSQTMDFLKHSKQVGTRKQDESMSSYGFPSLSAESKRFEVLQSAIFEQYTVLQQLFGFDKMGRLWISRLLKTLRCNKPVQLHAKAKLIITWVFIFVASQHLPSIHSTIDEHTQTIKRMLRVDCVLRRGQFEALVELFSVSRTLTIFHR